jgi:hypothetical protein
MAQKLKRTVLQLQFRDKRLQNWVLRLQFCFAGEKREFAGAEAGFAVTKGGFANENLVLRVKTGLLQTKIGLLRENRVLQR